MIRIALWITAVILADVTLLWAVGALWDLQPGAAIIPGVLCWACCKWAEGIHDPVSR